MLIEVCFEKYKDDLIRKLAYFSRDEEESKDAVHEAFFKALKQREMLEKLSENSLKAWLYSSARNALTDVKRRTRRMASEDEGEEFYLDPDITDSILAQELMGVLPQELADIVALKYFSGFNSVEIGNILGIPAATVRTRLRAALTNMRKHGGNIYG